MKIWSEADYHLALITLRRSIKMNEIAAAQKIIREYKEQRRTDNKADEEQKQYSK